MSDDTTDEIESALNYTGEIESVDDKIAMVFANEYTKKKFPSQINLPTPAGTDTLWRYLDFTQYASIIQKGKLHFSRPDQFNDKFEGSLPSKNIQKRREWADEFNIVDRINEILDNHEVAVEEKEGEPQLIVDDDYVPLDVETKNEENWSTNAIDMLFKNINKVWLESVCLNCWHNETKEKAAMWDLYSKNRSGIAIKSSFNNIIESIDPLEASCENFDPEMSEIYIIGEVDYIDYQDNSVPETIIHPFFYKRDSFSHENEVRIAYIQDEKVSDNGVLPSES